MRLTILNLTEETISCRWASKQSSGTPSEALLRPSNPNTFDFVKSCELGLLPISSRDPESKEWIVKPEKSWIRIPLVLSALWRVIRVPDDCPWRIYLSKVAKTHHRLFVLRRRDLASFLSELPDTLSLASLCLAGTHETNALHGWPISQCQALTTPLAVQLQSGIRVIDVRLSIIDGRLISYHGIYPQRTPFQETLTVIHDFLTAPATCRETIVMSIKQEDFARNSYLDFSRLVHEEIFNGPGGREMWFLQNRVPSLGEVRGKVVLFSRFGGNGEGWEGGWEGLGIHPLVWPDGEKHAFTWQCKDTLVSIHDWYKIPSFLAIPEKVALATQILLLPPNNPPMRTLAITFLSAASFPLALPPTVAKGLGWPKWGFGVEGVNSRFVQWILNNFAGEAETTLPTPDEKIAGEGPRIRGWALMDYYDEPESALTALLVECNYMGRRKGEEGW